MKGFYDTIDQELLRRAVRRHPQENGVLSYIERWLNAPVEVPEGSSQERLTGTLQGGVVSPLRANVCLHYACDQGLRRKYPNVPVERYADDALCHCRMRGQAEKLKSALEERCATCQLTLHPEKTQGVYCQDSNRRGSYSHLQFTFLGCCFRPRRAKNRWGKLLTNVLPAVSPRALKRMRARIRRWRVPQPAP